MNSRFLFSRVMLSLTAATSAFFVACSDIDTAQDPQKPTEGIMFSTSDVQDRPDASLPKTKGSVLKPSCKPILLSTQFHKPI